MTEDEKLEIVGISASHRIDDKQIPSKIKHMHEEWPDTEAGAIASWNAVSNLPSNRDRLMQALDDYDAVAQQLAARYGLKTKSTLQNDDACTADVGTLSGSTFALAHRVESHTHNIRIQIADFEQHCTDPVALQRFYQAMRTAADLVRSYHLLELRNRELETLRGDESKFNHHGTSAEQQRAGIALVNKLMDEKGIGKTAAVRQVANEYGKTENAVFKWLQKTPE